MLIPDEDQSDSSSTKKQLGDLTKLKCDELRKMAEEHNIKISIKIDGKTRRLTK